MPKEGYTPTLFLDVAEAAAEYHTSDSTIFEYASRKEDPLPLFHSPWCERKAMVKKAELEAWMDRNGRPYRKSWEVRNA